LEYKPTKSLKKRLENIIDFTGDENDYVVVSDLTEHFERFGSESSKKVGDALTKMGIKKDLKRLNGKPRLIRLGIKLKDFENITEEYGDDTSAELSFASTDGEMVSPMRRKSDVVEIEKLKAENNQLKEGLAYIQKAFQNETGPGPFTPNKMKLALEASLAEAENTKLIDEITALKEATAPAYNPEESELQELRDEITALKQTLERQNLSSREEEEEVAEEEEEDPLLVPEVSKKKIDQLLSTTAKTMRSSTVQNVLKGLNAKVQEWEGDYMNQLQELTEAEEKIEDYITIIKQVERQTRTKILDDNKQVLPDVLRRAKDVALVDTPDTN
jgi:DNA repair exonuclease SbcCD ATPase subunit